MQALVMTCCTLHKMCDEDRVPLDAAMIDDQARVRYKTRWVYC
jgi:hypothetical protein